MLPQPTATNRNGVFMTVNAALELIAKPPPLVTATEYNPAFVYCTLLRA